VSRPILIITCGEPDATPFLAALPQAELARTLLISTRNVIAAALRQTAITEAFALGGPSTFDEARRLLSGDAVITVVTAPDPWGPFKGKGYVRMRQALPFVLPDVRVDLVDLERGGVSGRVRREVDRRTLARWLRRREALLIADHVIETGIGGRLNLGGRSSHARLRVAVLYALPRLVIGSLLAVVTLARCLAYVVRTESRARMAMRA
jgi:hypothetical protein